MVEIGYKLSSEELGLNELVRYTKRAEEVGVTFAMISDHYYPPHAHVASQTGTVLAPYSRGVPAKGVKARWHRLDSTGVAIAAEIFTLTLGAGRTQAEL